MDPHGNTYILDYQTQEVTVLDPKGKPVKVMGHQGEGPGETTLARKIFLKKDGGIGLVGVMPDGNISHTYRTLPDDAYLKGTRDGVIIKSFTRDGQRPMRSQASINKIKKSLTENYSQSNPPIIVGENDPWVNQLWITDNSWGCEIWIESAASFDNLPDGVMVRNINEGGFDFDDETNPRFDDTDLEVICYRVLWEE